MEKKDETIETITWKGWTIVLVTYAVYLGIVGYLWWTELDPLDYK